MKKAIILIISTTIMIASAVSLASTYASIPTLPATIQDPLLQEGWTLLNQKTIPVQLWDGQVFTGHDLAQYIVDHAIPIVWDLNNICYGGSCSLRCQGEGCTPSDNPSSTQPIYISPLYMQKIDQNRIELVEALAHEIYHRTMPYGPVDDTLYEEFSAYYVAENISGNLLGNFDAYDPLQHACLVVWFYDSETLPTYIHLHAYPQAILPFVDHSSPTCPQKINIKNNGYSITPLTSILFPDGSFIFFPPSVIPTARPDSD
jgi:hypothetical protein